jgi:hypothetical protein
MRIDTDTAIWIVSDPMGDGTGKDDILFETTLRGLERQFRGGLTCDENPVIFTDPEEARVYAEARLEAWRRHREEMTAIEAREKEEQDRYRAEIEALR